MKKIISLIIVLTTLLISVSSCSGDLVNMKFEGGKMYNKRYKLEYYPASTNYEPVSIGPAYGYYKNLDMTLYQITGADPHEWLTEEYAGNATTIFYSTDITLPTLEEMNPTKIYICSDEGIVVALAVIEDKALIDETIDIFLNGEYEEYPLINSYASFDVKFYSEDYPQIYYKLTYGEFPEGKFLYDRNTKRSVRIGELFGDYIGSYAENQ